VSCRVVSCHVWCAEWCHAPLHRLHSSCFWLPPLHAHCVQEVQIRVLRRRRVHRRSLCLAAHRLHCNNDNHTPAQHTPVQHTPVQHTPVQHTPVQHTPVQHTPVQHTHVLDTTNTSPHRGSRGLLVSHRRLAARAGVTTEHNHDVTHHACRVAVATSRQLAGHCTTVHHHGRTRSPGQHTTSRTQVALTDLCIYPRPWSPCPTAEHR
jgi:hypothetical protein